MLGLRGCAASQGVLLRICVLSGDTFLFNFICLYSLRYAFQSHSKLYVPPGYTISRFLIVFYALMIQDIC